MAQGVIQMLRGNPQGVFNNLLQTNPEFARMVRNNAGKSDEQIARENGIDMGLVRFITSQIR